MVNAESMFDDELASVFLSRVVGLDTSSDHSTETPRRFVEMLKELTTSQGFKFTTFPNENPRVDEMVVVEQIPFVSLCLHHVIPFIGYAHVAYIPDNYVAGLSKFARAVRDTARGLWVQEHLTQEIHDLLSNKLEPQGLMIVMKAEHLCMTIRGVQTPGALTTTSAVSGVFADHSRTAKAEFMAIVNGGNR